ncbi:MAG: diacylglycerol/lipid kinase family protein, partial [Armatimonadota bacterium]
MRIAIVANPLAGRRRATSVGEVARLIRDAGHEVQVHFSESAGHCRELAAAAAQGGCEVVAAAGGDGTLSQVARGILHTNASLALIPFGTGNDFCLAAGISRDPIEAGKQLVRGCPRPIDVCWVGDKRRPFVNIAGVGFDAAVANVFQRLRWPLAGGTWGYLTAVVLTLFRSSPARYRLRIDNATIVTQAWLVPVCNAISYARGMRIAPGARIDDGKLDVCVVGAVSRPELLRNLRRVFAGAHTQHPAFSHYQAEHVHIEADPPQPVMVDGDPYTHTPVEFGIMPGA